jgi:hypothetical protein
MDAHVKTAVLMFALSLASAAPAAGIGGASSSAASSSAASSGGSSASARGGSTNRTGGGMYGIYRRAPELEPSRKISEQDCTKPIVHDGGNLRCK